MLITFPHTEIHQIKCEINNIEYKLFVALPPKYHENKNSYPVIFTTDPSFIFPILLGAVKSLESLISDAIIVGIGHADLDFQELNRETFNNKRDIHRARDFLPWKFTDADKYFSHVDSATRISMIEHSGHAEQFIDLIEDEIIPFIDKTYRIKAVRTLIGHSFGAILASYIALNRPTIFQNYIVISPILDLENGAIFKEILHFSETVAIKIYFCAGEIEAKYSGNKNFLADLEKFQQQINFLPNVDSKLEIFNGEYHASVVPLAVSKGLRFLDSVQIE